MTYPQFYLFALFGLKYASMRPLTWPINIASPKYSIVHQSIITRKYFEMSESEWASNFPRNLFLLTFSKSSRYGFFQYTLLHQRFIQERKLFILRQIYLSITISGEVRSAIIVALFDFYLSWDITDNISYPQTWYLLRYSYSNFASELLNWPGSQVETSAKIKASLNRKIISKLKVAGRPEMLGLCSSRP